ncbi:sensor histidine kinase [Halalkalibacter akibai JCM 9157]|uniref:histidine kinase n=1 Tax=Halalkalibacter akibai (strain ATCC 43226 / DSM 21942 / CIP 109018 / JCM 9157 / 1139) TaxID=1236973 RepID=W4QTK6_HALA3|nr:sensor histidine kinase [Halalkalibacter akibai JCM 9157]
MPIILKTGEIYGTLCAIDTSLYTFQEKDILLLQSMASFLAYFIELENAENLYRQIVEKSPDGIMVEKEGKLIYANPATAELYGKSLEDNLIGELISDILLPGEESNISENQKLACEHPPIHVSEKKLMKADGTSLSIETIENSLSYKGEAATQIMVRDITYRKQIEDLINNSEKLSVAGQLAAGVAHEIRNPLTGIKGFIQLLKATTSENAQYYDIIMSEVERINEIVNEFLYLAKPEIPHVKKQDLLVLINEVVMLLNTQAILKNVQIHIDCNEIPLIYCESNQIKQVLINIVKNAIEIMPDGGNVWITVRQEETLVKTIIRDEGKGIPKERLVRLGEPFYTTKEKGTGLGLMVSRKIIEEHRGTLSFASTVNIGTEVTMILPIN